MKHTLKAAACAAMLWALALPAMAQSLTTTYANNNGQGGATFDLVPSIDLTIDSFDANVYAGTSPTVSVYWRVGTANGFDSDPAGWTLLGTANVVSQGDGHPTHIPIGGLTLSAGQTYGIYMDTGEGSGLRYTTGANSYSNGELTFISQNGKARPVFSNQTFTPRTWNGTVYYHPTATCASEGYRGTQLTWCKNICENGLTGQVLDTWIHRWINRYRDLPYCAVEQPEEPPQES